MPLKFVRRFVRAATMDYDDLNPTDDDLDPLDRGMDMPMIGIMPPYFEASYSGFEDDTLTVLFKGWKVDSVGDLVGSVFGIFFITVLYEALKYARGYFLKASVKKMKQSGETNKAFYWYMFQPMHLFQAWLQMCELVIAYFLMLIFMTYNVWLCLAIVVGSGVGYFLFGWIDVQEEDSMENSKSNLCH